MLECLIHKDGDEMRLLQYLQDLKIKTKMLSFVSVMILALLAISGIAFFNMGILNNQVQAFHNKLLPAVVDAMTVHLDVSTQRWRYYEYLMTTEANKLKDLETEELVGGDNDVKADLLKLQKDLPSGFDPAFQSLADSWKHYDATMVKVRLLKKTGSDEDS